MKYFICWCQSMVKEENPNKDFLLFARIQFIFPNIFNISNLPKYQRSYGCGRWLSYLIHSTSSNMFTLALFFSSSFTISACPCSAAKISGDLDIWHSYKQANILNIEVVRQKQCWNKTVQIVASDSVLPKNPIICTGLLSVLQECKYLVQFVDGCL